MQEKIYGGTPPEIKIFEGKPPPYAWVNQNIVGYLQARSQIDFLREVLLYAQQQQAQRLANTRTVPLALKEAYVPFPEKGSAKDISNAMVFNSMQNYLKTQINSLEKLMMILKQGNPKLAEQLNTKLAQLKQLAKTFPRLSTEELENLSTLMNELTENYKQLPMAYQRAYCNTQLMMMQSLMADNGANIKELQSEVSELQARSQMLLNLKELLENIQTGLKAQPPSLEQILKLLENLQKLANSAANLNPVEQQALLSFFGNLASFKNTKGENLTAVFADSVIQTKMNEFLQANPNASPEEVLEHLRKFLNESNLQSSNLPFMKSLGDAIEDVLNKKGFPVAKGFTEVDFATIQDNKVVPNKELLKSILAGYAPSPESLRITEQGANSLVIVLSSEEKQNQIKIEGYKATLVQLRETQKNFGQAAVWSVGQSLAAGYPPGGARPGKGFGAAAPGDGDDEGGGLPSQFSNAILNHFMPQQEQYLEDLAMFMFITNTGAEFGNVLLSDELDFGEASDNFAFSNFLKSATGKDIFTGSASKAQQELTNEKSSCSNDINSVKKALQHILSMLAQIQSALNKPLTPSQRALYTKMEQGLQDQAGNLQACLGQLQALQQELATITITDPTGTGKTFKVTSTDPDWQKNLSRDEYDVINGSSMVLPPGYPGGLVKTQALAQNFQQKYSDQGQNMQMILEMNMTETQQMWTLVGEAMKILNRVYDQLAQAIYKG